MRIQQRPVHFSLVVFENAQVRDFFGQIRGRLRRIFASHTQQHDDAGPNLAGNAAFDDDSCAANALDDGSQVQLSNKARAAC
jgi:hypothetical protein